MRSFNLLRESSFPGARIVQCNPRAVCLPDEINRYNNIVNKHGARCCFGSQGGTIMYTSTIMTTGNFVPVFLSFLPNNRIKEHVVSWILNLNPHCIQLHRHFGLETLTNLHIAVHRV